MIFLLLVVASFSTSAVSAQCERDVEIICYWGSWSIYRTDIGTFDTSNINTDICTTIVYAFAGLNMDLKIASLNEDADITKGNFANFSKLKNTNPCLKTILAIGGWNEGSQRYSIMAGSQEFRKEFANSVIKFLSYYDFDGVDIDWEYPTIRGGIPADGENFVALLGELKNALSPWGMRLSIAVSIDDDLISTAYDISAIAELVDSVNVMAYDYISSESTVTGLSSPLSEIKATISKWLEGGLPSKKLVLGLPAYAKNFVLADKSQTGIGAPVAAVGRPGIWTQEYGLLAYYEVLDIFFTRQDVNIVFSDDTNYAYYDDEWFTYDNETTVKSKVKYAMDEKLGGIMIWALELDDFSGIYGNKYPLLNAINDGIKEYQKKIKMNS